MQWGSHSSVLYDVDRRIPLVCDISHKRGSVQLLEIPKRGGLARSYSDCRVLEGNSVVLH